MDMIYSLSVVPMKAAGKECLWVCTSDGMAHYVDDVLVQVEELKSYLISTPSNPVPAPEETDLYYYVSL